MRYRIAMFLVFVLAFARVLLSQVSDSVWREIPPTGPFTKSGDNPIYVNNAPRSQTNYLAGNMVQADGKYWIVVDDRSTPSWDIILISSTDLRNWQYETTLINPKTLGDPERTMLDAPHIFFEDSTWYLFYDCKWTTDGLGYISIAHSTSGEITGPYLEDNSKLLSPSAISGWDSARVWEPYFVKTDSASILIFMGDAGNFTEQIGIATSNQGILGPYVESSHNPVLAFSPTFDSGTLADPWVFDYNGCYYIGYCASTTKFNTVTTYATTTNWKTFAKSWFVLVPHGPAGSWDGTQTWRGNVIVTASQYVLVYTGRTLDSNRNYIDRIGITTQPAYARRGDISLSGDLSPFDASLILGYVVGDTTLTEAQVLLANVSGNEAVTAYDASLVLRSIAGDSSIDIASMYRIARKPIPLVQQSGGQLSLGSPQPGLGGTVVLPIDLSSANEVTSVQLTINFKSSVSVKGVNTLIPKDWQVAYHYSGSELNIAMAGVTPISSGEIGSVSLSGVNISSGIPVSCTGFVNEDSVQSLTIVGNQALPTLFTLKQNYPNPFNPSTVIGFTLSVRSEVVLSVYDILGRQVAILENKKLAPGNYSIPFDAKALASGMYFYRLSGGGITVSQKMMLVK